MWVDESERDSAYHVENELEGIKMETGRPMGKSIRFLLLLGVWSDPGTLRVRLLAGSGTPSPTPFNVFAIPGLFHSQTYSALSSHPLSTPRGPFRPNLTALSSVLTLSLSLPPFSAPFGLTHLPSYCPCLLLGSFLPPSQHFCASWSYLCPLPAPRRNL